MTRFAGKIRDFLKDPENTKFGSIDYLTPLMSSQQKPSGGSSYLDSVEDKRKELDEIVRSDGGPWKNKTKEKEEPIIKKDPVVKEDPVDEKSDGLKFQEKLFAKHLAAGMSLDEAMKYNRTTTPEDWKRAYGKCDSVTYTDKHPKSSGGIPSDCYWPDERSDISPKFGGGGGTKHAKAGQAKARAKAAQSRKARNNSRSTKSRSGNAN